MKVIGKPTARTAVLLGILCIVAIAYFVDVRVVMPMAALNRQLHGDANDVGDALAKIKSTTPPDRYEGLLLQYADDQSPVLREAAVEELAGDNDQRAIDAEEHAFSDSSADVRYSALYNVNRLDRTRGIRLIAAGLHDQDTLVRESAAADALDFGDKRIVPNLIAALDDPDPTVSRLAMAALRKITGQSYFAKLNDSSAAQEAANAHWRSWLLAQEGHWTIDRSIVDAAAILPTRTDPAPDFDLRDVNGQQITLAGQQGHITLLNFWGTWCPPCLEELPDLIALDRTYRARRLDVIGVALQVPGSANLGDWCRAHQVGYRVAIAPDKVLDDYGDIEQVPVSVLIDASGRIRYRWEGPRDYVTFSAAVERLLKELKS